MGQRRPRACVRSNFVIASDECLSLERSFRSESTLSCQTMHFEVEIAGDFVVSFLTDLSMEKIEELHYNLSKIITNRYEGHWYPSQSTKGNAYRCLNDVDPVLIRAIQRSGLNPKEILSYFPENLSVWVDPNEVSYRNASKRSTANRVNARASATTFPPSNRVRKSLRRRDIRRKALGSSIATTRPNSTLTRRRNRRRIANIATTEISSRTSEKC